MKSIRKAFEVAREKAKIEDLHLHDFRHTCITNWTKAGIPQSIVMAASGHHSVDTHKHLRQYQRAGYPGCFQEFVYDVSTRE